MVAALRRHLANKSSYRKKELVGIRRFNRPDFVPNSTHQQIPHIPTVDTSTSAIPFEPRNVFISDTEDNEDVPEDSEMHGPVEEMFSPIEEAIEEMFEPATCGRFRQPFPSHMRAGEV